MTGGRLVVWLLRRPMLAVLALLGLVALAAVALTTALARPAHQLRSDDTTSLVAPHPLPSPTQQPPPERVRRAHRALHALGRACTSPVVSRVSGSSRQPLDVIEAFAADYPSGGFTMDDESGTTLALLIVVANELRSCDPSLVPEVTAMIPAPYRGG